MQDKQKIKILYIDDDQDDFIIVRDLLREVKKTNYDINWVSSYAEGLFEVMKEQYDVLLVDYRLGEKTGIDVITELQNQHSSTPVILLTGQNDFETDFQAMKAGANDYLEKGKIEPEILERSIRYAIERKRSERKIKQLNQDLEKRVIRRTEQLQSKNKELHKEISERKRTEQVLKIHAKQQAIVSELGLYALKHTNVQKFMDKAIEEVAQTLSVDYAEILKLLPEGKTFMFSSGVGWSKDIINNTTVPNDHTTQAGLTFQSNVPVIVTELKQDSRLQAAKLLLEHGVVSGISAVIYDGDIPYGVIGVHSKEKRKFTIDDINFVQSIANILSTIIARNNIEKKIYKLAYHDPLTALPNRTLLLEKLGHAIKQAKKNNKLVGVVFLDLDRFKNINDSLGHKAGDELLKTMAERLRLCVRDEDIVSRQGGDEFIIILPGLSSAEEAEQVSERIIKDIADPFDIEGKEIYVTPSVGISLYPKDANNIDILIQYADVAMYWAKRAGGNTIRFFTEEMNAEVIGKLNTEIGLRNAIRLNEFKLYFQPKLSLDTNKIVGVEALIRWDHPIIGIVPPDNFIPAAEETGLIEIIGEWALRTACKQCKEWHDKGLGNISISVNLSPRQLNTHIAETVQDALETSGLHPKYLELEVTESDVMRESGATSMILQKLKDLKISIAIDDFGTGYSSFARLKELPLDTLKIDKLFISDLHKNQPDSMSIIKAIIAVGKTMKLKVVAETVETEEQVRILKKLKCDQIQGYYVSKPIANEDFVKMLEVAKNQSDHSFFREKLRFLGV